MQTGASSRQTSPMTRARAPFDMREAPALRRLASSPPVRALMQLTRNPRLHTEPETVFEAFRRKLEQHLDTPSDQAEWVEAFHEMLGLCATLTTHDCELAERRLETRVARDRRAIASNGAGASLLSFLDDAASRHPSAPLLGVLDPTKQGLATLTTSVSLRDALAARRELRSKRLLTAAAHVFEALYLPYLRALWRISQGAHRAEPRIGRLLSDLEKHATRLPGLVLPEASQIRNAASHYRSAYVASSNSLALHEIGGWQRTLTVPELKQHVLAMRQMAGATFPRAISIYVFAAVKPMIRLLPDLARAALAEDAAALAALGPQFELCFPDLSRRLASGELIHELPYGVTASSGGCTISKPNVQAERARNCTVQNRP